MGGELGLLQVLGRVGATVLSCVFASLLWWTEQDFLNYFFQNGSRSKKNSTSVTQTCKYLISGNIS